MGKRQIWLAAAIAAAATAATPALAQDEAAFRAQMIARCGTIADAVAATACVAAANRGPAPAAVVAGPPGAADVEAPAPAAPAAPAGQASPAPAPVAAAAQDSFGAEQIPGRRRTPTGPDEATAAAVEASDDGRGYWTITLDTGARWRMTEAVPNFRPPKAGEPVRIKKGAVGGYLMSVGRQANVRVTRID